VAERESKLALVTQDLGKVMQEKETLEKFNTEKDFKINELIGELSAL